MPPATRVKIFLFSLCVGVSAHVAGLVLYPLGLHGQGGGTPKAAPHMTLDLTEKIPFAQQGFPGIPGQSYGGPIGSKQGGSYELPVETRIIGASPNETGDFTVRILLRNIGKLPFKLPILSNLTAIEKAGNKSPRILFFRVEILRGIQMGPTIVGSAAVGGTESLSDSFLSLDPGQATTILLPASGSAIQRLLEMSQERVEARVICNEWDLEESGYVVRASSEKVVSENAVKFVMTDGKPAAMAE
jgi:hypothetical protein